ncbi:MAG: nitronate monooxygenase [Sneathiella sp.]
MADLKDLCGVENTVFQAGMGGIAGPELAASVSNAGGLGHLGGIRMAAKDIKNWIQQTKSLTDAPFGINLVPMGPGPDGFDAQLSVVFAEKPKVLSLFWGDFSAVIPRAKAAGITTMVQVGSVAAAKQAAKDGADIIIAQGVEAGGHVAGNIGLMALVPAIIKEVGEIPVLAAGGIASPEAVKAARSLGARGVWVGTSFVASNEALAHDIYKQRLIDASTDDTHHGHFYSYGWPVGTPYRVILPTEKGPLQFISGGARRGDSARKAKGIKVYAGQGVGEISQIRPAADILASLSADI